MISDTAVADVAATASLVALWLFVLSQVVKRFHHVLNKVATGSMLVSFLALTAAMALRWIEAGRFPFSNLYESLILFGWSILAVYLILYRSYRLKSLGLMASLLINCLFLYANWLPATQKAIVPLMPALVSNWRCIHVPPLIVSYALLVIAGIMAIAYLWKSKKTKTAVSAAVAAGVSVLTLALSRNSSIPLIAVQTTYWCGSLLGLSAALFCLKLDASGHEDEYADKDNGLLYDEISQLCITAAFPLLTFGIITGALWANHAWGNYWSWDPKESMSLVTWLSYALYLHLRARPNAQPEIISVMAVVGLVLTLLTYLGFSFLGFGGLHSYGQIT